MTFPEPSNPDGSRGLGPSSWTHFLDTFHGERPGITAEILDRSIVDSASPYRWLVEAVSDTGTVVDVACGNGPLAALIGPRWIGTDRSESELVLGLAKHAQPLVISDAATLPFATGAADTVVCSMALQVTEPLSSVLAEIVRVLRPGGRLVATVPARHPLTLRDRWRYFGLIRTLRDSLSTPNDQALSRLPDTIRQAGLELVSDEVRRFEYSIDGTDAAERFVSSLYLRDVTVARFEAANKLARQWVGTPLGIPIRRFVCIFPTGGDTQSGVIPRRS